MKTRRQEKILDLIGTRDIDTQDELLKGLAEAGFDVTQATVSRDIKELRLVKILSGNGKYRYAAGKTQGNDLSAKFHSLFSDSVLSVSAACNLVVINTMAGMAQAVCAAMDPLDFKGKVGTLAGDDTIFIACANDTCALEMTGELKKLIAGR